MPQQVPPQNSPAKNRSTGAPSLSDTKAPHGGKTLSDDALREERLKRYMDRIERSILYYNKERFDSITRAAPGAYSHPVQKAAAHAFPGNKCGSWANYFIASLDPVISNMIGEDRFTIWQEVLSDTLKNHSRILVGTPKGIYLVDGWKQGFEFYPTTRSGVIRIPNEFAKSLGLNYNFDPTTSTISLVSGQKDDVTLTIGASSKYASPKRTRKGKG